MDRAGAVRFDRVDAKGRLALKGKAIGIAGCEEEGPVESCSKKKTVLCLAVLAALNLAFLLGISQVPFAYLSVDSMLSRVLGEEGRQENQGPPVMTVSKSEIHFRSCSGGESPYCHKISNQAGL